jgi:dTDP-4-dehydrorhamnose 3,5-epimerase
MEIVNTELEGVQLVKPDVFEDHRGEYVETYNEEQFHLSGIKTRFVQDDFSISTRQVLRGIHGDFTTWKLVSCIYGKFYLVVVNCNEKSPKFGAWQSFVLSDRNRHQVLIPPGYGNGHVVLSDCAIYHYKQSTYYDPTGQFTYKWNDPRLNIWWPVKHPILSQRDEVGRYV